MQTTRRHFLKTAAALAVAPTIIPASVLGAAARPAPSNRINCAVIGLGDRGSQHTGALCGMGDAQVLAVCDPYRSKGQQWKKRVEDHYAKGADAASYKGCADYQDFREIIARPDIDAVAIAAPENWHVLLSIAAMRAGKDVYCEKALSLTVAEGLRSALASEPMPVPGEEELRVTCCFGVVEYAATDVDGGSMLARADTALYRAKALGRNRVEFDGSL